jgi:hypothetical protein
MKPIRRAEKKRIDARQSCVKQDDTGRCQGPLGAWYQQNKTFIIAISRLLKKYLIGA